MVFVTASFRVLLPRFKKSCRMQTQTIQVFTAQDKPHSRSACYCCKDNLCANSIRKSYMAIHDSKFQCALWQSALVSRINQQLDVVVSDDLCYCIIPCASSTLQKKLQNANANNSGAHCTRQTAQSFCVLLLQGYIICAQTHLGSRTFVHGNAKRCRKTSGKHKHPASHDSKFQQALWQSALVSRINQ